MCLCIFCLTEVNNLNTPIGCQLWLRIEQGTCSGSPLGSFHPPKMPTLHGLWLPEGPEGFASSPTRGETVNLLKVTVETGQILIPCASPSRHIQICQFSYCIKGMRYCEAKYLLFQYWISLLRPWVRFQVIFTGAFLTCFNGEKSLKIYLS